jgi:hypothetical protein
MMRHGCLLLDAGGRSGRVCGQHWLPLLESAVDPARAVAIRDNCSLRRMGLLLFPGPAAGRRRRGTAIMETYPDGSFNRQPRMPPFRAGKLERNPLMIKKEP